MELYNRYSEYIKKTYNYRVQKITVDAGFTCPNRDGTKGVGGCIYCNNESFAPVHLNKLSITEQINHGIAVAKRRYKVERFFVYFQPYSNTYAPLEKLKSLYEEALNHPDVIGLCIGTRPDCIDQEKISYLEKLGSEYDITIEYGFESLFNETLERINRCHLREEFFSAIDLTKNRGIKICAHMIIGFPWEGVDDWVETSCQLSSLPIDFLKIHQLQVIKDTALADQYQKSPFKLLSKNEYLDVVIKVLEHLDPKIVIQRLFGEAPPQLVVSPRWNIPMSLLLEQLETKMFDLGSYQGRLA